MKKGYFIYFPILVALLVNCVSIRKVSDNSTGNFELIEPELDSTLFRGSDTSLIYPYAVVEVFFATDRNLISSKIPNKLFGNKRSTFKYGVCKVSVPRDYHIVGELERPAIWKLEFREDPKKHLIMREIVVESKNKYFKDISEKLKKSPNKNAFLFIHGYNVSFEEATLRTAQISYDLGFDGVPAFYSWPSNGTYMGYLSDEETIQLSELRFKNFLIDFLEMSQAKNIYLIAHSMGNRAMTSALISLAKEKPHLVNKINEIILAAPDINADIFKEKIAPALIDLKCPVTLYSSSSDEALIVSKKLHGGFIRIGDNTNGVIVIPGIETIDATNVNSSFIGHSYIGDSRSVISDIFNIINYKKRADYRFGLRRINFQNKFYWEFKK